MSETTGRRVVLLLDIDEMRRARLQAAARLAAILQAELHAWVLESSDAVAAADLPFTVEISLDRGARNPISSGDVARWHQRQLREARRELEHTLGIEQLRGELKSAASHAELLADFRRGDVLWLQRRSGILRLPLHVPPSRDTLYVAYGGTAASRDALQVAQALLKLDFRSLVIIDLTGGREELTIPATAKPWRSVTLQSAKSLEEILDSMENRSANTLLLPGDLPCAADGTQLLESVGRHRIEVLLIH